MLQVITDSFDLFTYDPHTDTHTLLVQVVEGKPVLIEGKVPRLPADGLLVAVNEEWETTVPLPSVPEEPEGDETPQPDTEAPLVLKEGGV